MIDIKPKNRILSVDAKSEREFLHKKTKEVPAELLKDKKFQRELRKTFETMRKMMLAADGVGLSANQVGINYRFFVARATDKDGKMRFYSVVNPKILKIGKTKEAIDEGCLSVPLKFGPVERAISLTLECMNLQGKKAKIEAKGLLARVFQHETDHLDGKLFIDKAKYVERIDQSQKIKD